MTQLVYQSESRIHGTGAFAGADLPRDLHVRIPYRRVTPNIRDAFEGGLLPQKPFCFLNHSQRPNCEIVADMGGGRERVYLRLLRKVPRGKELTIHYGEEYWQTA